MSEQFTAMTCSFEASMLSDDGETLFVKVCGTAGDEAILAIPSKEAFPMIGSIAQSLGGAYAPAVEWLEVGKTDQGEAVLSLDAGGGQKMSFRLGDGQVALLRELLALVAGEGHAPPEGAVRN